MGEVPKQLTPFKPKGDKRSDEFRARQKGSSSIKRKRAQKINAIRRMSPETIEKKALRMVTDEQYSAVEIEKMIQEMLKKPIDERLRAKLIDTGIKAHTAFHGTKSKNINLNIDAVSVWEKMIEKAKKEIENEQRNR